MLNMCHRRCSPLKRWDTTDKATVHTPTSNPTQGFPSSRSNPRRAVLQLPVLARSDSALTASSSCSLATSCFWTRCSFPALLYNSNSAQPRHDISSFLNTIGVDHPPRYFCPTHSPSRALPTDPFRGGPSPGLFPDAPSPAASCSHTWSIDSAWSPAVWK